MEELNEIFDVIDLILVGCDIDCGELEKKIIDQAFFEDYSNQRVVNSFLFNFIKVQEKAGSKLFKKVLIELKEIDSEAVPMRDILNALEKLAIIESADQWELLREMRNMLTHEYPRETETRVDNIKLALSGYRVFKKIYTNLKRYCRQNMI